MADTKYHGGIYQAVYAFAREDLDLWVERLGQRSRRPVRREPHHQGIDINEALIGEQWRIGTTSSGRRRPHPVQRLPELDGPLGVRPRRVGQAVHDEAGPVPTSRSSSRRDHGRRRARGRPQAGPRDHRLDDVPCVHDRARAAATAARRPDDCRPRRGQQPSSTSPGTERPAWHDPWRSVAGDGSGDDYQRRFDALAASGAAVHGEADFVARTAVPGARVLDAGCGTGRVAIELSHRAFDVAGVDLDPSMLAVARRAAPDLTGSSATWHLRPAELARCSTSCSSPETWSRCSRPAPSPLR